MLVALRYINWLTLGAIAQLLLTLPISVQAQSILGLGAIAAMIAVWLLGRGQVARMVFLSLGTFIVIRYAYWRLSNTLPPPSDVLSFTLGLILVGAELYYVLLLLISVIINADPIQRKSLPRDSDDDLPTVDVFIPSYNEDEYILATTIAAARSLDYPPEKLKVWLLDDGGTDQKCNDSNIEKASVARQRRSALQHLCQQLGAHYLTRAVNEHAKAGNLNGALAHSKGEIIVVFDADHAPFRAFLRETIGHFKRDPKLFLVQTPHAFLNPDPIEKNLDTFRTMPSENEMFYSLIQRGLDKWDGSFFCGSAALLRREALLATNGFSGITITEDCETAFDLHAKGWHSVYVDKPLIAGLQPETFASFIGQRTRWCQGMLQIFLLKNPLWKKGLKPMQRLAYVSTVLFWFFAVPRLLFTFAPLLYIFFDFNIVVANAEEAVAYTAIYIVVNMMLQNYLYGSVRWPWVSEIYEYAQGVFLVKAMASVILAPRKPTFNVTSKGLSLDNDHLSELALPFFIIWGLLLASGLTAGYRYLFDSSSNSLMLVAFVWNAFNLMISGAALGVVAERAQPDPHPRLGIDREGLAHIGDRHYAVHIKSVSTGGCALAFVEEAPDNIEHGSHGRLFVMPLPGPLLAAEQLEHGLPILFDNKTSDGLVFMTKFKRLTPRDYFVLAELMYADSDVMQRSIASRRKFKNLLDGARQFIWWGVSEPVRAMSYVLRKSSSSEPVHSETKAPQSAQVAV